MTNNTIDIERRGSTPKTWTDAQTLAVNTDLDNFTLTQHADGALVLGTGDHSGEDLAPDSVTTTHLATEERGPQVVCCVGADNEKFAVGPNGIIARGWTADDVLQAGANWLTNNGYGTLVVHDRMVIEDAPLVIPKRVRVHCSESGVLVNKLADRTTPFVQFDPEATARWLRVNANGGGGIRFGTPQQQTNAFADRIYLFGVGAGQPGIQTRGYQVSGNWWHVQGDGTNSCTGFDFRETSDVFINSAIAVGTQDAAVFDTTEHVFIPALDCDSGSGTAITLGEVHDMHLGCTVWCNTSADADLEWDTAINSAETGHTHSLTLDAVIMRSGRVGLRLTNISASRLAVTVTNETAYPAVPDPMDVGIEYGPDVADTVQVDSQIDPDLQTAKLQGSPAGTLNGTGYEAAGEGNSPTLDVWNTGQLVINTDDDTVWLKRAPTGWLQLAHA
jgi:hypothetical protein